MTITMMPYVDPIQIRWYLILKYSSFLFFLILTFLLVFLTVLLLKLLVKRKDKTKRVALLKRIKKIFIITIIAFIFVLITSFFKELITPWIQYQ